MSYFGISIDDWFMNFKLDEENRFAMPTSFEGILTSKLMDSELETVFEKKLITSAQFGTGWKAIPKRFENVCEELRSRSRSALAVEAASHISAGPCGGAGAGHHTSFSLESLLKAKKEPPHSSD